MFHIFIDTKL